MPPVRIISIADIQSTIGPRTQSIYETMSEWAAVFTHVKAKKFREGLAIEVALGKDSLKLCRAKKPAQQFAGHLRERFVSNKLDWDAYCRGTLVFVLPRKGGPAPVGKRSLVSGGRPGRGYRPGDLANGQPIAEVTPKATPRKAPRKYSRVYASRSCQRGKHYFVPNGPRQLNCDDVGCAQGRPTPKPKPPKAAKVEIDLSGLLAAKGKTAGKPIWSQEPRKCPYCPAPIEHPLSKTCGSDTCKAKKRAADYHAKHPNSTGKRGRPAHMKKAPPEGDPRAGIPALHTELPPDSEHHRGVSVTSLRGKQPTTALRLYAQANSNLIEIGRAFPILQAAGIFDTPDEMVRHLEEIDSTFERTRHTARTYELQA